MATGGVFLRRNAWKLHQIHDIQGVMRSGGLPIRTEFTAHILCYCEHDPIVWYVSLPERS